MITTQFVEEARVSGDVFVSPLYDGALADIAPIAVSFGEMPRLRTGSLRELDQPSTVSVLHLVAEDNGQERIPPGLALDLTAALDRVKPTVLLLDACYSPAEAQTFTDRVPHVIGLPGRMGRERANEFLNRWYDEYRAGRAVLDAFDDAFDEIPGLDLPELLRPGYHGHDDAGSHFRGGYSGTWSDVTVWYGTNRSPAESPESDPYGTSIDDHLHLGQCVVRIPDHIEYGKVASRLRQKLAGLSGEYTMVGHQRFGAGSYWAELARVLDGAPFDRRDVVVHIRGFNCLFREAAVASAQLHVDLHVRGVSAFYSFPSRGTRSGYWADDEAAQHAERYIYEYLRALATNPAVGKVHVIAYSMGNRPLLRVAMRAAHRATESGELRLGQVVLAGADVSQHFFRSEAACFREIADGVTLYVSSSDRALQGSALFHLTPRAGQASPMTIVDGIHTIDVSKLDMSLLGHGYFQQASAVLTDLHALLTGEPDPADRPRLRMAEAHGGFYWAFRA